jgi:hypothetical protein
MKNLSALLLGLVLGGSLVALWGCSAEPTHSAMNADYYAYMHKQWVDCLHRQQEAKHGECL